MSGRRLMGWMLALLLVPASSNAQMTVQSPTSQVGFTGGVSIDPEQGFVGVFWQSPEIGGRFHLRPGIDGGFGGGFRMATIHLDFVARFPLGASGWDLVQGGGPAVSIVHFGSEKGGSDVGAGGSYIIGFAHDGGLLAEFRIGAGGRVPNLKLGAGFGIRF